MRPAKSRIANAPIPPGQDRSSPTAFFTRLPYDIRAIIYSYLAPEILPPLSPRFPTSIIGFVGSCRQAQQEIEEVASDHLQGFLSRFKTNNTISATITRDAKNPKCVIITLPFSACVSWTNEARWKPNVLISLHPLFAQPFDLVRIYFSPNSSIESPIHNTAKHRQFDNSLHSLLSAIVSMISRINVFHTSQTVYPSRLMQHLEMQRDRDAREATGPKYYSAPIVARRICLSYDFRPRSTLVRFPGKHRRSDNVVLTGTLHQIKTTFVCRTKRPSALERLTLSCVQAYKAWGPAPALRLHNAACYTLSDASRAIGEVGLVSPSRWDLTWDYHYMEQLMWEQWRTKVERVKCRGLGGEIGISRGKG